MADPRNEVVGQRLDGRMREHVRARLHRPLDHGHVERVCHDRHPESVSLVSRGAGDFRGEHRITRIERELCEARTCLCQPLHGRARAIRRGELQPVPVRTPRPRRITTRRRHQWTGESDAQRRSVHREQALRFAEIEDRGHPAAKLRARDLRDVPGDGEVDVRIDERWQQDETSRIDDARPGRRFDGLAADGTRLDRERGLAESARVEDAPTRDPQLRREQQSSHVAPHYPTTRRAGARCARAC